VIDEVILDLRVLALGITRELITRGHDVRMIGHDTIAERCGMWAPASSR